MPKKIGLEIGTSKTKVLINKGNKFNPVGYEVIDTPESVYSLTEDMDIMRMQKPLEEVLMKHNAKKGDLYVSISNDKVIIRTRELPRVAPKDMMGMVRFEAESFLPYDIDSFYIDYRVLNEIEHEAPDANAETEKFFEVLVIAVPKVIVDQYIELSKVLNLKLKSVSVYTEVLEKLLLRTILKDEENILVVDIGHKYINMTMYEGKNYFANIKSERGMGAMFDRLIDQHGFKKDDILFYLYKYDSDVHEISDTDRIELIKEGVRDSDSYKENILRRRNLEYDIFINEINRMVGFFRSRKYDTSVDKIYIVGGGSNLSNFPEIVSESLNIECEKFDATQYLSKIKDEDKGYMISVIGTCLGGKA